MEKRTLGSNLEVAAIGARVAERKGATPAQIALAWILAQKP
jgi:aryl-alcohol dehydrogenase-like predicted oxidoreductase